MVTVKNADVVEMLTVLGELAREKLPVKGALKVRKIHRTLSQAWTDVEDVRKQLFDEYAEKDANGDLIIEQGPSQGARTVKLKEGATEAFNAAWDELMAHEIEVADVLTAADMGTAEIRPHILIGLGDLLTD